MSLFLTSADRTKDGMGWRGRLRRDARCFFMDSLCQNDQPYRRHGQYQRATDPPVRLPVAAQPALQCHDGRGQAAKNACKGNDQRKQTAGLAPQDIYGRRRNSEEKYRRDGGQCYMTEEG